MGESFAARLQRIASRIADAGGDERIQIVGVAKGHPRAAVDAAVRAGLRIVGESYAQEVVGKYVAALDGAELQFIGHLQSNKVRALAGRVGLVASVDRPSLVDELAKRMPGVRVFVQPNLTADTTKSGCAPQDTAELVERCSAAGLRVEGLMTIGPASGEPYETRRVFRTLRTMVDRLGLTQCSMGMSDDLEIAVGEGATQVRVGTALFGPRPALPVARVRPSPSVTL